jgi:hypothetical protein
MGSRGRYVYAIAGSAERHLTVLMAPLMIV